MSDELRSDIDATTLQGLGKDPDEEGREDLVSRGNVWRAALLAGVFATLGAGVAGFLSGNTLGTASTERELSACVGIKMPGARTLPEMQAVVDDCFKGENLAIVRTRLNAKIDELVSEASPQ